MSRSHVQRAVLILSIALLIYPFADSLFGEDAKSAGAIHNPDFDGNGVVDFDDFSLLTSRFGMRRGDAGYEARFDLDGDGVIEFRDFLIYARYFGQVAPVPVEAIPARQVHVGGDPLRVDVAEYFYDANGDALRYTASSDDEAIASVRVSNAVVAIVPVGAGSATVTVTALDTAGLRATQTIAVSVTLFARTPLTRALDENAPAGEPVGDPVSVPGRHALAYRLSGADADGFDIDARTGQIRTRKGVAYDHERDETFSLIVVATDGDDADSIAVTISVTDVDEPPSSPPSHLSVQPGDQSLTVHFYAARDEPGKPPVLGYHAEIRPGEEGDWVNRKTIYGRTNTSAFYEDLGRAPRYQDSSLQNGQRYQIRVRTWNAEGESDWAEPVSGVPVYVPPRNRTYARFDDGDAATQIELSRFTGGGGTIAVTKEALAQGIRDAVEEVFAEVTEVSNFPAVPPQAGFAVSGSASIFDITLKTRLANGEEVNIGGDLRVPVEICLPVPEGISNPVIIHYKEMWEMLETQRVAGNAICAHAATFSYYGVGSAFNDVPEFAISPPPLTVPENTAAGQNIGNPVTATDSDGGTLVYSLEGTDAASFAIDANTGQIQTKAGVTYNYEAKSSYSVTVKVVDGQGGSATIPVIINLTDVDGEAPGKPAVPNVAAVSSTRLKVTWTTPANTGPPITDYDVQYRLGNSGAFTDWPHSGTELTATITSLTANTSYGVRVRAINDEGTSAWSDAGNGTTSSVPTLSINSPSVTEGNSGSATLRFAVSLSAASGQQVTVAYADDGTGTATSGTDYTAVTSGILTFTAGQTSKNIDVSVTGDALHESNETVILKLSSANNATIATGTGTGTITDDDGTPTLSINSPSVTEGNSGSVTLRFAISLSAASGQQVTVAYADDGTGTATSGTDYTAVTSGTLTFTAGQTSKNIDVSVTGDALNESNETVILKLSSANNATIATGTGTGTITNDDGTPTLSINSPSVTEGNSGSANLRFTVSLSAASGQQVTVAYADDGTGTATSGTDYTAVTSGTLTFTAGQTSKNIDVSVTGDALHESNETVILKLSSANNATIATGTGTGTITDDDGTPTLSINSPSVTEGNSGSVTLRFAISLSAASGQQVTVAYADDGTGTATSGTDYTAVTSGTLTFTAGQMSKNIDVSVTGDALHESNETVILKLSSPTNANIATGTGTGTITNDDGTPTLSINSPSVTEGNSGSANLRFTVSLSAASGQQVTVAYADDGTGTATSGTDYTAITSGTLTFTAGQMSKNIDVSVTGDALHESNETVIIKLSSPNNATIATGTGTGTITDDDGTPTLSINSPSVTEGNSGSATLRFTVSLSAASGQQVTVAYADDGTGTATSGTDYTAITSGTLTFTAGQTSKNIDVSVTGDALHESNETVILKLSSASNATIATGTGTGTITDDDSTPTLSINSPSVAEGNSGSTNLRFTVSLSAVSGQQVTVAYADDGTGTATSGTDYTAITAGILTFTAGQTSKNIDVSVTGDALHESNETVILKLSSATNANIATGTGTGTITNDDGTPTLSINSPSVTEGNSGSVTLRFTVSLSAVSGQQVTVAYADDGTGTATSGTDYTAVTSGTLTFTAGQTSKNIDVSVTGDALNESNETVILKLSSANNATIATGTGTGTITNDDGTPTLSINSPSVTEGNSGSANLRFTVSLSAASGQQVTVAYADDGTGTATSGTDYTAVTSGTLTFTAGQTSKNIDVSVTGDALHESNETVILKLSSANNATIATGTGTGTITDDDGTPTLSINSPSVTEGNSGSVTLRFAISLSAASGQQVTVAYADDGTGTATSGTDYTAVTSGILTFTAGQTSKNIDVSVTGDALNESNETVILKLSSATNANIATGTGTGTITDDDGTPTLSINSPSVTEGNSGSTNLRFTVSLSAASGQQVTVAYADDGTGTATSGTDYTAVTSGTLTFTAGQMSKNIDVSVTGDALHESNETVILKLSSPTNANIATGTGTGTITNDDGTPTLSINSPSVTEGNSGSANLRFTVSLSAASGQQVTVAYADDGTGTATSGTDYTAITSGTLTFTAGQMSKNIDVSVTGDALHESNETVIIKLSSPNNATIATGTGTGTITDDDGTPTLSINSPSVTEGNSGSATLRFTVSLSVASGQQVTVAYADDGTGTATSGTDYTAVTSGTLTFTAGQTSKNIDVSVTGDALNESNETVIIKLSSPSNATIATGTGTGTITDDDGTPTLSINSPSVTEGNSGSVTLRFAVSLSAASGQQVTVAYADDGTGTATSGTDYTAITSGILTFTAGQTSKNIDVSVTGDALHESNETVILKLSSPSNATIATGTGTGTITDDDGTPTLSINSPSVTEGNSGSATLRFTVSLSAASGQQVTVAYADDGTGTATSGTDYTAVTSGTLTFTAGQTSKNIDVSVTGDALNESNETVIIKLSSPSNATIATGTGTGTITDDDGTPTLSINSPSVTEGNSGSVTLRFAVSLSAVSGQQVTVAYADDGTGTATSGTDYTAITSGILTFTAGQTSKNIDVSVTGDALNESNETVILKLSSANNATIATGTGTGTITDDDLVTAGICGRTQVVRDTLLAKIVGQSNCATVTATHLSTITGSLDFRHKSIAALKAEDFAGLSNLGTLRIDRNNLTTLPAGIFSDLSNLRTLRLNHNQLNALPNKAFSNLSNLRRLALNSNSLQTLPDSMFFGLSSLTQLELHNNVGADFTLTLALERTDNADLNASGPATVVVKVAEGAPFDMSVNLSVTGGTLSNATATISKGGIESGSITVTQSGMMQATISLGTAPMVPSGYQGIATAVGTPLTLWAPGICGRTTAVSNAIVSAVNGVSDCASVTGTHLQSVTGTLDISNQSLSALRAGDFSGLSDLETLWLYDNRLSTLPDTAFASLSNLRFLSLYRNRLTRLPDTVFASLDSLKTLHLNDNRLSTLPDTAFAGMDSLQTLLMDNNTLTALPDTAFYDLPNLQTLHLNDNLLSALPDSAFKGLDSLKTLRLNDNSLSALPDSAFKGLDNLKILYLNDNMLSALPDSAFRGLDSLQTLHLNDNSLSALPDSAFKGLDNLRSLHLNDNALSLLRDRAFMRLSDLQVLDLASNSLSTLPQHAFKGLSNLQSLDLAGNSLSALPDGVFAGLSSLNRLNLSGNAALDFILTLVVERTDNANLAAPGPATLKVKVAQGAPFDMSVGLSITGGSLSEAKATIAKGDTESAAITVTQVGGMLATVRLGGRPGVPAGYAGIQTAVGDSLVLFGTVANRAPEAMGTIGDVTVAQSGSAANVNVARAFSDPDGDALTFGATASVSGLATLSAMDSVVTITPVTAGIATITVTAADPDGLSATQTFSLTVTNSAPTVQASISDTTALVNTPFTYAFPQNAFRDADRDALTYTSSGGPAWLTFTPATRTFSGTPSDATGSPFAIAVVANDGKGGRVQTTFTLSVAAGICTRTAQVQTALLSAIADADTCTVVTDAHLAGVVDSLNLRYVAVPGAQRITSLKANDFSGLSNLTTLNLYDHGLTSLPAGAFDELSSLRFLSLYSNALTALSASVFDELSRLRFLSLDGNSLTALPSDVFSDLPQLQTLSLSDNGLTALPAGVLDSLANLRELALDNNALTALPAGVLDSLSQLQILSLNGNNLSALRTGAFANLSKLRVLNLKNNALTALPNGVFTGMNSLMLLDLSGNTGANFTLTLALERTDHSTLSAAGPATLKVKIAHGAPFDMTVTLSATSGTLTDGNAMALSQVTIPRGSAESAPITVTQTGMSQTTVNLGTAPAVPSGYRGIATAVGVSLVLF